MKNSWEERLFVGTTALIFGGFVLAMVGFIFDIMGQQAFADTIQDILDGITTVMIPMVLFGWYAVLRYFSGSSGRKTNTTDYILLFCAFLVPPSGIYVLRYIRRGSQMTQKTEPNASEDPK